MTEPVLIVVGGGIAGSAAALRAAQNHMPTVWILGDHESRRPSRSEYVKNIDNMIGVHPWIMREKVVRLLAKEHPDAARQVAETHFHVSTNDIIDNVEQRIRADYGDQVRLIDDRATNFHHQIMPVVSILAADVHATNKRDFPVDYGCLGVISGQPWIGQCANLDV